MTENFLGDRVCLHCGDMREVLAQLAENSFDACVTDPPYHLTSIVKRFGDRNAAPAQYGADGRFRRASAGFMGKQWDGGDVAFDPETWRAIWRVLKPGAHICTFTIPKHVGFVQIAMQHAGFEFRDMIVWAFGSGFPKSHDVSKGIDRAVGAEREKIAVGSPVKRIIPGADQNKQGWEKNNGRIYQPSIEIPATDAACQWEGWGTALKPAVELIVLARKPLSENTVAANVLKWGTGAINVDGCRVSVGADDANHRKPSVGYKGGIGLPTGNSKGRPVENLNAQGRWPANVIHDGSEEVVAAFPESGPARIGNRGLDTGIQGGKWAAGERASEWIDKIAGYDDNGGSAARFFYTAKADSDDRVGSKHPTVKPLDLIQYLVRLITPPKGTCIDPFAGTGTTGEAAWREGMRAVLIEREAEYIEDIRRRMALALAGPDERTRESIKAKNLPRDDGPLFAHREQKRPGCPHWPGCGCGTQSGPHTCEYNAADDLEKSINACYAAVRERKAAGGKGWPE